MAKQQPITGTVARLLAAPGAIPRRQAAPESPKHSTVAIQTMADLENYSAKLALRHSGPAADTKEQVFARLLRANPDLYDDYRTQHAAAAFRFQFGIRD